jgi:hypothetical protein
MVKKYVKNAHQGNTNQKYSEVISPQLEQQRGIASYAIGGNVNQLSHYGKQYGGSLKKQQ